MVKVDSYNRDTVLYTKFYDSHNLTIRTFSCDYVVTVYELDSDDNITINGVTYDSITAACNQLNKSFYTIKKLSTKIMRLIKIGASWCGPCNLMDKRLKDFNACDKLVTIPLVDLSFVIYVYLICFNILFPP